jgi:hypothetical protein
MTRRAGFVRNSRRLFLFNADGGVGVNTAVARPGDSGPQGCYAETT